MRKTLFSHEVKPPTSKTFNFFQCKGITPFLLHFLFPDFLFQIVTLFIVRSAFASPSLCLRFKTVLNSMQVRSLEWARNGTYKGFATDLHGSWKETIRIYDEFISLRGIKPTMWQGKWQIVIVVGYRSLTSIQSRMVLEQS